VRGLRVPRLPHAGHPRASVAPIARSRLSLRPQRRPFWTGCTRRPPQTFARACRVTSDGGETAPHRRPCVTLTATHRRSGYRSTARRLAPPTVRASFVPHFPRAEEPTWFLQPSSALAHWGPCPNGTPRCARTCKWVWAGAAGAHHACRPTASRDRGDLTGVADSKHWYDPGEVRPREIAPNPRCESCSSPDPHGRPPMFHPAHPWGPCWVRPPGGEPCQCRAHQEPTATPPPQPL
jgi:hypothetical protein